MKIFLTTLLIIFATAATAQPNTLEDFEREYTAALEAVALARLCPSQTGDRTRLRPAMRTLESVVVRGQRRGLMPIMERINAQFTEHQSRQPEILQACPETAPEPPALPANSTPSNTAPSNTEPFDRNNAFQVLFGAALSEQMGIEYCIDTHGEDARATAVTRRFGYLQRVARQQGLGPQMEAVIAEHQRMMPSSLMIITCPEGMTEAVSRYTGVLDQLEEELA